MVLKFNVSCTST